MTKPIFTLLWAVIFVSWGYHLDGGWGASGAIALLNVIAAFGKFEP